MINDQPIAHTAEGRPLFDNTPTVVAMLVCQEYGSELWVIRRANHPGRGLIGLPGGYHMRGESWQEAGCREVREETGILIHPKNVRLVSMETDEYGNNLIIAIGVASSPMVWEAGFKIDPAEVMQVIPIIEPLEASDWAFPRHYQAAIDFLNRNSRK